MVGLVKAARGFDPQRGNQFVSYATATIVGELKRHFRDHRWGVHVARSAQEQYLLVREATEWARAATGRAPTVDEIAEQAGLTSEAVVAAQELSVAMHVDSLDAPDATLMDGDMRGSLGVVDRGFDRVDDRVDLLSVLLALPDREREILWLRFVEDRSQSNIAERLAISQMHVSRLIARTLQCLRLQLSETPSDVTPGARPDDHDLVSL
jgi:RNA polymerase sigma-B factor